MQTKKRRFQCEETRGIFRCQMQSGHISERHQCGDAYWFVCRECGRNHSMRDHWKLEAMVTNKDVGKNGPWLLAKSQEPKAGG